MDDELVKKLIDELAETRKSFDGAIRSIKWNRINSIIQYSLILIVFVMVVGGIFYVRENKRALCVAMDKNATAIGITLVTVSGADPDRLQEYLDVYHNQDRGC